MSSRAEEHAAWNREKGLREKSHLDLVCPRCWAPHVETITSDVNEPDYYHHVHQCTHPDCGIRFDVFVRCRSRGEE